MAKPTKVSQLFASGIALPFAGDSDGGVALSEGETYVLEQVRATVHPNDSDNPFQDLGVTDFAIFQNPTDPTWRRTIRERIKRQFAILESNNLARFVRMEFAQNADRNGDYDAVITYTNLETTSEASTAVQLTRSTDVGLRPV